MQLRRLQWLLPLLLWRALLLLQLWLLRALLLLRCVLLQLWLLLLLQSLLLLWCVLLLLWCVLLLFLQHWTVNMNAFSGCASAITHSLLFFNGNRRSRPLGTHYSSCCWGDTGPHYSSCCWSDDCWQRGSQDGLPRRISAGRRA